MSVGECNQILCAAESVGYTGDAPLAGEASVQKSVLAHNFFWLADETLLSTIFERIRPYLPTHVHSLELTGLNARCRLYRYIPGIYIIMIGAIYRPHIDGAWPASGMIDEKYHYDMHGNQRSRLTLLLYLNDDFKGGRTTFFVPSSVPGIMNTQAIIPRTGCVAIFPHGDTKGSLLHEGSSVIEGTKYILRTDVLYRLPEVEWNKDSNVEMN